MPVNEDNIKAVHFIEDKYHRYAIVLEDGDGHLGTGSYGIPEPNVQDHVRTAQEMWPDAVVHVEPFSGEPEIDPEPIDEPYPKPRARRAK